MESDNNKVKDKKDNFGQSPKTYKPTNKTEGLPDTPNDKSSSKTEGGLPAEGGLPDNSSRMEGLPDKPNDKSSAKAEGLPNTPNDKSSSKTEGGLPDTSSKMEGLPGTPNDKSSRHTGLSFMYSPIPRTPVKCLFDAEASSSQESSPSPTSLKKRHIDYLSETLEKGQSSIDLHIKAAIYNIFREEKQSASDCMEKVRRLMANQNRKCLDILKQVQLESSSKSQKISSLQQREKYLSRHNAELQGKIHCLQKDLAEMTEKMDDDILANADIP